MKLPLDRTLDRSLALHLGVLAALALLQFLLPAYHHGNVARILALCCYAMGYNILLGYTGLLSLGHAMFFAAGLYGAGLPMRLWDWSGGAAFLGGVAAAALLALAVGALALRAAGVAFMIVTLMFAQAAWLTLLYFNEVTGGSDGFTLPAAARGLGPLDMGDPSGRYWAALLLFALCLGATLWLTRSPTGRVLVAIRENEERTRMLGFDTFRYKLLALVISAGFAGAAGALYALMFGYVGASFAAIQYSILPLLWVLLGGAGVALGPLLGATLMFYLVDLTSAQTSAYMMVVGLTLLALVLVAPKGLLGAARARWAPWLP